MKTYWSTKQVSIWRHIYYMQVPLYWLYNNINT
jgi:hypothetical protein